MKTFRLLLSLVLLSACQKNPPCQTQTAQINIVQEPETLDSRKARALEATTVCRMLFEGLTRISKEGKVELALADQVEISGDGLRYRFTLKQTSWSNGDPVTASDFVESWRAILDPQFPSDIAYQLYLIKNGRKAKLGEVGLESIGISAPDSETLLVELEEPTPYFLDVCATTSYFPVPSRVAKINPNWALDPATFVGNGPFLLKSWSHTDHIGVAKNPNYWDAKAVALDELTLVMVNSDTEMRMFEENKLDWAGSPLSTIPPDAIESLKKREQLKLSPLSGTYFFRVNTNPTCGGKRNPLSNASFRRALALGIDRDAITTHLLQGGQLPARSLVPPEMGLRDDGYFLDQSTEMGALLAQGLKELECTLGELEPIAISFRSDERNIAIAQAVQQQWESALGIKIEINPLESKVFFEKVKNGELQLAAGSWVADFNDPINFLEVFKFKDGSTNNTGWENSKYVDLLNGSALCRDQDERWFMMQQAEEILMEQMPVIPIFHFAINYLQNNRLKEVALSPIGQIDFRWARIDED